jgi:hypothetical protein
MGHPPASWEAGQVAGSASGERWSWSETVAVGVTVTPFEWRTPLHAEARLRVRARAGVAVVRVTLGFDRSSHVQIFHVGQGGEDLVPIGGAVQVQITPGTTLALTYDATVYPTNPDWFGLVDDSVVGLVQGVAGAPGAWTNPTDLAGFAPPYRHALFVHVLGTVEYQLLNEAGAQRAFGALGTAVDLVHPPRYRIQFRHPGGAGDTRGAVLVYRRY